MLQTMVAGLYPHALLNDIWLTLCAQPCDNTQDLNEIKKAAEIAARHPAQKNSELVSVCIL